MCPCRSSIRVRALAVIVAALAGTVAASLGGLAPTSAAERSEGFPRLKRALAAKDPEALEAALEMMVREGGAGHVKRLVDLALRIPSNDDATYWSLVRGAASFVDTPALEELGKSIVEARRRPLGRDLLYALAGNQTRYAPVALGIVAREGSDDQRLLALIQIGTIASPESIDALIAALETEEKKRKPDLESPIVHEIVRGLTRLTGEEFGANSINWKGWWSKHREDGLSGGEEKKSSRTTGTAVDWLDSEREHEFAGLEEAPEEGVVVLTARYEKPRAMDLDNDHMETVLERMGVPHTVVTREELLDFDLSKTGAILINCAQFHEFCVCPTCKPGQGTKNRLHPCVGCDKHIPFSAQLTPPQVEKLQSFVAGGGFLFSEDWIVKEVLEKAFPRYVTAGDVLRESTVDVVPARGSVTHPYLRGIFLATAKSAPSVASERGGGRTIVVAPEVEPGDAELVDVRFRWKIDNESFALDVQNPAVVSLLTSGDVQQSANGDGWVAVAFRPGSRLAPGLPTRKGTPGVVLAVLSHFGKQGRDVDELSLQNLLLNFLIDANAARRGRIGKAGK